MATEPTTPVGVDPASLADELRPATRWLFLLDFDGCLSPLVDEPEDARPEPGAVEAIRALAAVAPVALVSGRGVDDLRRRLPDDLPATLAGGHGAEVAEPGEAPRALVDVDQSVLDRLVADLEDLVDPSDGWRLERKSASVALHHRMVRGPALDLRDRTRACFAAAEGDDFVALDGHDVVELRPTGTDKGVVVDLLAARHPDHLPLSFGDDVTDEDAFRTAVARGGRAVLVAQEARPSAAAQRLTSPADVVAALTALATPQPGVAT